MCYINHSVTDIYGHQYIEVGPSGRAVCGRSPAEIMGSKPSGGIVCRECCVLSDNRSLRRADHSSRGVLPTVVRRCV
jgi:hypothetical protein